MLPVNIHANAFVWPASRTVGSAQCEISLGSFPKGDAAKMSKIPVSPEVCDRPQINNAILTQSNDIVCNVFVNCR